MADSDNDAINDDEDEDPLIPIVDYSEAEIANADNLIGYQWQPEEAYYDTNMQSIIDDAPDIHSIFANLYSSADIGICSNDSTTVISSTYGKDETVLGAVYGANYSTQYIPIWDDVIKGATKKLNQLKRSILNQAKRMLHLKGISDRDLGLFSYGVTCSVDDNLSFGVVKKICKLGQWK